ncbi:hypothetical protein [Alteromonas sp. a30]|uniref:hypothetical protein n=1 Tax=Alteromonas sp. a30 TaxID=2730917 RepID=UPI0022812C42|nr:hypothetical protein [Alteromonas sp. a30]MCY7297409.1 hypothetical protein [Alteromonas sp. a30]
MSISLAFALSLLWVLLLVGACVLNYTKSRDNLYRSSLFVLFMYAAGHFTYSIWLMPTYSAELVKVHYLFSAAMQGIVAFGLFFINRKKLTLMMGLTVILFALETILTYAVHIDRNVMALNGAAEPNMLKQQAWFLWDMRNIISTVNSFTVLVAVVLGKVYKVDTTDSVELYDIVQKVEDFVKGWEDSALKREILMLLDDSADALLHWGDGLQPHLLSGTLLLEKAIELSYYEPDRSNCGKFARFMYWLRS